MVNKEDGIPMGLGFGLAMNEDAMKNFAVMNDEEKSQVIAAARNVQSKQEMQHLIQNIADLGSVF